MPDVDCSSFLVVLVIMFFLGGAYIIWEEKKFTNAERDTPAEANE